MIPHKNIYTKLFKFYFYFAVIFVAFAPSFYFFTFLYVSKLLIQIILPIMSLRATYMLYIRMNSFTFDKSMHCFKL